MAEDDTNKLPEYLTSPDATLGDRDATWRHGSAPDYSKVRKEWLKTKTMDHTAGSLPQLVENLVKNWEVEASFKPDLKDWKTIDHASYSFAINGGAPQSAEHMLKVGTYNAIISENEFYSPEKSDFAASHKTFKRMMPTFAWEVLEVYSGPPKVAFKWRHWGVMENDYAGTNGKGEKVVVKAHGGPIEITGMTVASVNDKVQLQAVDTFFDPLIMFKQIAPNGLAKPSAEGGTDNHQASSTGDELEALHHALDQALHLTVGGSSSSLDDGGPSTAPEAASGEGHVAGDETGTSAHQSDAKAAEGNKSSGGCPFLQGH